MIEKIFEYAINMIDNTNNDSFELVFGGQLQVS
jgi:hypothetical protein